MPAHPPLDGRTSHRDRALERVYGLRIRPRLVSDGGDQSVIAPNDLLAGIEQHKATCSIGILRLASGQAFVAHERGLLVANDTGDRNASERGIEGCSDLAIDLGRGDDAREDGRAKIEEPKQWRMPLESAKGYE